MATEVATDAPLRPAPPSPWAAAGRVFEHRAMQYRRACRKCGAQRIDRQIGLEDQPAAYVDSLVAVFRQVRRILRPDGVVFLNLGDTYNTGASNQQSGNVGARGSKAMGHSMGAQTRNADGLKFKDLIGIPWRVAFALQADGWYLRSDIAAAYSRVAIAALRIASTFSPAFVPSVSPTRSAIAPDRSGHRSCPSRTKESLMFLHSHPHENLQIVRDRQDRFRRQADASRLRRDRRREWHRQPVD